MKLLVFDIGINIVRNLKIKDFTMTFKKRNDQLLLFTKMMVKCVKWHKSV